jgi:hypothetical protein
MYGHRTLIRRKSKFGVVKLWLKRAGVSRPLDRTDIPNTLAVSVPKSFPRHINMTATERVGLAPFTRKPLFASHILSTRGSRLAEACKEHVNGKNKYCSS